MLRSWGVALCRCSVHAAVIRSACSRWPYWQLPLCATVHASSDVRCSWLATRGAERSVYISEMFEVLLARIKDAILYVLEHCKASHLACTLYRLACILFELPALLGCLMLLMRYDAAHSIV